MNRARKAAGAEHGTPEGGKDYDNTLEYFDETTSQWKTYTPGQLVEVPTDGKLQVRVPIKQDDAYEGPETFELKASNTGGKSRQRAPAPSWTMAPAPPGCRSIRAIRAYRRPTRPIRAWGSSRWIRSSLAPSNRVSRLIRASPMGRRCRCWTMTVCREVNDIIVNEGSGYGVFIVTGEPGQKVQLELSDGTAEGGKDYDNTLEYFDETTSQWKTYTPGQLVEVPTDGKLQVRVPIKQDDAYEGPETFELKAKQHGRQERQWAPAPSWTMAPAPPGCRSIRATAYRRPTRPIRAGRSSRWIPQQPGTQQPGEPVLPGQPNGPKVPVLDDDRAPTSQRHHRQRRLRLRRVHRDR